MKCLIVDDSPTMRRIVSNALREIGYTDLFEAEDGNDALEKLAADPADLVITDWNMPNMNGLQLIQVLRNHPRFKSIPILMVTTRGTKQDVITAMQGQASSYIVKPFTPEILQEKIGVVLRAAEVPAL